MESKPLHYNGTTNHSHYSMKYAHHHIQALMLSLASSTDNFLVGLSVGLAQKRLLASVLWGIALCNATGTFVATTGGGLWLHSFHLVESLQYVLAGMAFC